MSDKVTFLINDTDFSDYLKRFAMSWDLFGGPGTLNVELGPVTKQNENVLLYDSWSKETKFQFKVNDIGMMSGFVDTININRSKGMSGVAITGRDLLSILTDNYVMESTSYPPPDAPLTEQIHANNIEYYSIKNIIKDLLEKNLSISSIIGVGPAGGKPTIRSIAGGLSTPYINILYNSVAENILRTGPGVKKIRANYGQNLFEVISNLLNQRGIFLYAFPGGDPNVIVAFGLDPDTMASYNTGGSAEDMNIVKFTTNDSISNIIEDRMSIDLKEFYKVVRAVGQAGQEEEILTAEIKGSEIKGNKSSDLILDVLDGIDLNYGKSVPISKEEVQQGFNGQTKFRSTDIRNVDAQTWTKAAKSVQDNIQFRQYRGLLNVTVKVPGLTSGGVPYFMNRIYGYDNGFINTNMYCFGLQMEGSKDGGLTTALNLSFPWKNFFQSVPKSV
jgi:prophage tail gpP-like protein